MKMIIFTQCCCGCSVRTGSLIIGVLFTILSLTEFAIEEFQINSTVPSNGKNDAYVPLWFITVEAITNLIATLVNLSMLFGILTERLIFVLVWIIFYAAYSVFIIVAMVNSLVVLPSHVSLWLIPFYLLGWGVIVYCVLVVNSHYRNQRDGISLAPRQPVVLLV